MLIQTDDHQSVFCFMHQLVHNGWAASVSDAMIKEEKNSPLELHQVLVKEHNNFLASETIRKKAMPMTMHCKLDISATAVAFVNKFWCILAKVSHSEFAE